MAEELDFYQLLGVHPQASNNEIKEAFRRLAQKYHPDTGKVDSESVELFKRMTEAYQTLMDADSRNDYNKDQGYQFHEEVSVGGVTSGSDQSSQPEEDVADNIELAGVDRDWSQLHNMAKSKNDLNMHQKVAATAESELENISDEPEIAAWGDLESSPASSGLFSSLLGGKRRDRATPKRKELKKNLKKTMQEESKPKRPSHVFDNKAKDSRSSKKREQSKEKDIYVDNPLLEERVYKFQITSLEAALGCQRELVLSHSPQGDKLSKIEVDIPEGIESETVIEVARGWERATVQINVVQDERFEVVGNDIIMHVPITLKEALDSSRVRVPGIKESHEIILKSGTKATESVTLAEGGIRTRSGVGSLEVFPYIVAPSQDTATLQAASKVVDEHYTDRNVRREFLANPKERKYCFESQHSIKLFVPCLFGELLSGTSFNVNLSGHSLEIVIPPGFQHNKTLEFKQYSDQLKQTLTVQPYAQLPQSSSAELQAAALAIEQHFLSGVRSHLPRCLSS